VPAMSRIDGKVIAQVEHTASVVHLGRLHVHAHVVGGDVGEAGLGEHRDFAAAKAFFRSARTVTGVMPDRVTTDGHDAYPRTIRSALGGHVQHRTNSYLNNRLEQDHRGIKGRCRPMLGFKSVTSAKRYCRTHDELRNFLRCRSYMGQHIPASTRRFHHMRQAAIMLGILEAA
jgi:putative transposase